MAAQPNGTSSKTVQVQGTDYFVEPPTLGQTDPWHKEVKSWLNEQLKLLVAQVESDLGNGVPKEGYTLRLHRQSRTGC